MTRIARANDRRYVGDDEGFVPAESLGVAADSTTALCSLAASGDIPEVDAATAARVPDSQLSFDAPFAPAEYGKLWGIGLNYAEHASDLDEQRPDDPASFFKPATTATGPGGPIRLPPTDVTDRVTAEAELGVVVGRTCSDVAVGEVDDVVAGYVPVIDMTAEDILERNPRFLTRAKSFDTFLVVGPWVATPSAVAELPSVSVRTVVNGEVRAENEVANMHHSPRELVAYHSRSTTLRPGDLISTGTPGAHEITPGDSVTATVESVGSVAADVVR